MQSSSSMRCLLFNVFHSLRVGGWVTQPGARGSRVSVSWVVGRWAESRPAGFDGYTALGVELLRFATPVAVCRAVPSSLRSSVRQCGRGLPDARLGPGARRLQAGQAAHARRALSGDAVQVAGTSGCRGLEQGQGRSDVSAHVSSKII